MSLILQNDSGLSEETAGSQTSASYQIASHKGRGTDASDIQSIIDQVSLPDHCPAVTNFKSRNCNHGAAGHWSRTSTQTSDYVITVCSANNVGAFQHLPKSMMDSGNSQWLCLSSQACLQAFSPGLQVTERLKYSIEKEIRSQLAAKPRTSTWRLVATLIVIFIFVPLSALLAWDLRQQQLPAALPPPT